MNDRVSFELLVYGYIKNIQALLNSNYKGQYNRIIPNTIYQLCHQFGVSLFRILFLRIANQTATASYHIFNHTDFNDMSSIKDNVHTLSSSNKTKQNISFNRSVLCLVPNASNLFSKKRSCRTVAFHFFFAAIQSQTTNFSLLKT